jgi:ubiquinone/menaquinone biosynthesis C-methylase UbiE
LNSFRVRKIPPPLLKKFSEGCYVDSPVYFEAPGWVRWLNWAKLERLLAMVPQRESLRVLDFACGNGVMFPTWEEHFLRTVGIDLQVTAADRVRKHFRLGRVSLARSEGGSLPFREESFDLAFAASTLEHFADLQIPLEEIRRVLRQGGQMVFLCPNENEFYGWGRRLAGYEKPPDHYHSADEVLKAVKAFFDLAEVSWFPRWVPPFFGIYKMGRAVKSRKAEGGSS